MTVSIDSKISVITDEGLVLQDISHWEFVPDKDEAILINSKVYSVSDIKYEEFPNNGKQVLHVSVIVFELY